MKTLIIALLLALITGCSTLRGIVADEYTSEAEMLEAFDIETEYLRIADADQVDDLRARVLEFYRAVTDAGGLFDSDTLRDLLRVLIRQEILDSL